MQHNRYKWLSVRLRRSRHPHLHYVITATHQPPIEQGNIKHACVDETLRHFVLLPVSSLQCFRITFLMNSAMRGVAQETSPDVLEGDEARPVHDLRLPLAHAVDKAIRYALVK